MKLATKFRPDRHSFRPLNVASKKPIQNRFMGFQVNQTLQLLWIHGAVSFPKTSYSPSNIFSYDENQPRKTPTWNCTFPIIFFLLWFCFALPQPRMLWSSSSSIPLTVMNHIFPSQCFSFPVMLIPSLCHVSPSSPVSSSSLQLILFSLVISRPLC